MPNVDIETDSHASIEGFGMVFLEANECGKPVIGGNGGGTADAIIDKVTGFRVNPSSVSAISNAICTLLNNKELARKMGEVGHRRAVDEFGWEKKTDEIRGFVHKFL